jgi:hypothetical protein
VQVLSFVAEERNVKSVTSVKVAPWSSLRARWAVKIGKLLDEKPSNV